MQDNLIFPHQSLLLLCIVSQNKEVEPEKEKVESLVDAHSKLYKIGDLGTKNWRSSYLALDIAIG